MSSPAVTETVLRETFKTFTERKLLFDDLEEIGREKADARDAIPFKDVEFLEKIESSSRIIRDDLRELGMRQEAYLPGGVASVAEYARPVAYHCEAAKIPRKDCLIQKYHDSTYLLRTLITDMDHQSIQVIGKKCTWILNEVHEEEDPYNFASFLNDITACFHRSTELYADRIGKWRKEGKCIWSIK